MKTGIAFTFIFSILLMTSFGKGAYNNMVTRFENASSSTVGHKQSTFVGTITDIYNRTIGYNIDALTSPKTLNGEDVPFWGFGQGMSTQTGGKILGINKNSGFALAEWDGLRIVCESGLLFGWIIIFIRMGYVLRFLPKLNKYMVKKNYISLILYPSFFLTFFLSNTWGNSFNICFAMLTAGMFLASRKIVN